jgi:hypothetical protein
MRSTMGIGRRRCGKEGNRGAWGKKKRMRK